MIASMPFSAEARQWSLKDCIDYALANNISLQKTRLQAQSAHEDYLQSKAALLPSLSASTNQNVNYTPWVANGISGDGYSKASIDKVYYNGTYSVIGNYTLYDERQAKRISDRVWKTLQSFDLRQTYCWDDNDRKEWYCVYGGTAIVHNYGLNVWYLYTNFQTAGREFLQ